MESIFIDQATLNGTRPDSAVGVKPAKTPSGSLLYGSIPGIGPTPEDPDPEIPTQFPFPRFPIWPGNGEGLPDSRLGRIGNREIPRFPIRPGNGNRGPDWPQIGKSGIPCRVSEPLSTAGTILG